MITDRQLRDFQELLADATPGEWYISGAEVEIPEDSQKNLVTAAGRQPVLSGQNLSDLMLAHMSHDLLGEILEEIHALRQLPGDHHQRAGLHRKLSTSREVRQLPAGSIISNQYDTWCAELDKTVLRWRRVERPELGTLLSHQIMRPVTVLYEPDN
jgi:hypothetical protein